VSKSLLKGVTMNISFNSTSGVVPTSGSTNPTRTRDADADDVSPPQDSSSASKPGKFLAKLEALKQSDPAAFKKKLEDASQRLSDKAAAETDPEKAQHLLALSARFAEAAKTGDLSALKPPTHRDPPQAPTAQAAAPGAPASPKTFDPADANLDGKVTQAEQAAYDERTKVSKGVRAYREAASQHSSSEHESLLSAALAS
jgi:hypothetical protein